MMDWSTSGDITRPTDSSAHRSSFDDRAGPDGRSDRPGRMLKADNRLGAIKVADKSAVSAQPVRRMPPEQEFEGFEGAHPSGAGSMPRAWQSCGDGTEITGITSLATVGANRRLWCTKLRSAGLQALRNGRCARAPARIRNSRP